MGTPPPAHFRKPIPHRMVQSQGCRADIHPGRQPRHRQSRGPHLLAVPRKKGVKFLQAQIMAEGDIDRRAAGRRQRGKRLAAIGKGIRVRLGVLHPVFIHPHDQSLTVAKGIHNGEPPVFVGGASARFPPSFPAPAGQRSSAPVPKTDRSAESAGRSCPGRCGPPRRSWQYTRGSAAR